jgi:hypothetical protein
MRCYKGRSDNPGVPVLFGGHNLPPMVEIGLTDLPKSGGAMAPPGTTGRKEPIPTLRKQKDRVGKVRKRAIFTHVSIIYADVGCVCVCVCGGGVRKSPKKC